MTTKNIIFGVVIVVISVACSYLLFGRTSTSVAKFGAAVPGQLLAEYYLPFISTNQGFNSAFPIQTTSTLTATGFTDNGNANIVTSNTATSTLTVGCVQSYATSTVTAESLRFVASTTAPTNGSGLIPVVSYGTCP